MKTWLAAAAIALAAGAVVPAAQAEMLQGPRPSSSNNWPGIRDMPAAAQSVPTPAAAQPHYQWVEGYNHHGQWVGQWEFVR
jgi:hypothetical protein